VDFRAVRSIKEPASRAGWFGPSLRKRRVSGRVLGVFIAFAYYLRARGGYKGGLAAMILA
jgi:hypothetical protein